MFLFCIFTHGEKFHKSNRFVNDKANVLHKMPKMFSHHKEEQKWESVEKQMEFFSLNFLFNSYCLKANFNVMFLAQSLQTSK